MNIAIVGAGNVGRSLAGALTRAGHSVMVSSRKAEDARAIADETGAQAAPSNREAVQAADVVILAVPYQALEDAAREVSDVLDGKVLVDASNRVSRDDPASTIDGTSASEQLQSAVPAARVVKAFNTLFAARMANPIVNGIALDGLYAGDDAAAKSHVAQLLGDIGLQPVDAGGLAMARALEAMTTLLILINVVNGLSFDNGWKLVAPSAVSTEG
ncbi:MAG TPA: NADPH-dependent F420 reductase [Actinomycetota bacterium]